MDTEASRLGSSWGGGACSLLLVIFVSYRRFITGFFIHVARRKWTPDALFLSFLKDSGDLFAVTTERW